MIVDLAPRFLTWDEVDPSRHPFDAGSAARVVGSLGPAGRVPHRPDADPADPAMSAWTYDEGRPWADAMSFALVERYGIWAVGWRWAHDEGDFDGGPVGSWCCPRHSITAPEETLARVAAALCEWRGWLEDLAGWFEVYPLDPASVEHDPVLWERAARNLILQVADRTGGGSGWHAHCHQVLTWFLSRWSIAPEVAEDLVDQAIGGRFHSWISPEVEVVDEVAEKLALSLRPARTSDAPEPVPDHLERWLDVRRSVPWQQAPDDEARPVAPSRDGAAEDIRAFDGAVDPARAEGLLAALELARADAARGASLDFALLSGWQQHVLGTPLPPPFRTAPAFAKRGRERYGIGPDTHARLDGCLAESAADGSSRSPSLAARAARACLDVCYFHPFDDGNARAAFLALVFVLAREGVALNHVGLVRRVTFTADDPQDPLILARYIQLSLG